MKPAKLSNRSRVVFLATVAALSALAAVAAAEAKVTTYFSAGMTCAGAPLVNFVANGPAVKISLCVTTTTEALCGHTIKLQLAGAHESGRFHVTAVTRGPNYPDPNSALTFPIAITNPPAAPDFGATVPRDAVAAAAKQLLATFDVAPQANATNGVYTISLTPTSSVGVSADNTCSLPTDSSIAASVKLLRSSRTAAKK